jgi:hypothetical protein
MNGYLIRPQSQTVFGESSFPLYDPKGNFEPQGRITYPGAVKIKTLVMNMAKSGDLAWVKIVN